MLVLLGRVYFLLRDVVRMYFGKRLGEIPMVATSADIRAVRRRMPSLPRRMFSYAIPFLFIALIGGNTTLLVLKLSHDEKRYTVFTPLEALFAHAQEHIESSAQIGTSTSEEIDIDAGKGSTTCGTLSRPPSLTDVMTRC